MVSDISSTNNGHTIFSLEDPTGSFSVLVRNTEKELFELASQVLLDEVIGVTGLADVEDSCDAIALPAAGPETVAPTALLVWLGLAVRPPLELFELLDWPVISLVTQAPFEQI